MSLVASSLLEVLTLKPGNKITSHNISVVFPFFCTYLWFYIFVSLHEKPGAVDGPCVRVSDGKRDG